MHLSPNHRLTGVFLEQFFYLYYVFKQYILKIEFYNIIKYCLHVMQC